MIKTMILAAIVVFFATMMVQQVYAPEEPEKLNLGGTGYDTKAIPDWVKNQFEWYVNGEIDEKTLLTSMNWMFDNNIMHLSEKAAQEVAELRAENKRLHESMAQYRESDMDFANRMMEDEAAHTLGPDVVQKKHMTTGMQANPSQTKVLVSPLHESENSGMYYTTTATHIYTNENDEKFLMIPMQSEGSALEAADKPVVSYSDTSGAAADELGRIKVQFPWDQANKEDVARLTAELYKEAIAPTQSSNTVWIPVIEDEVLVSFENGDPDRPIIVGRVYNDQTMPQYELPDGKVIRAMKGTGAGGDITLQGGDAGGTGDAADYDRLAIKADLDEHEATISKFLVLQNELETIEDEIKVLTQKIDETLVEQKTLRNDIAMLHEASTQGVFPTKVVLSDGVVVLESARDADAFVKKWEDKLATVGDDAQLANIDLQNALQKQQQTLQTMSNVSKMLHDTAMAVIRKIG